ncbi:MAG TPA: DNA translocase FtsK 4TM domain-containing protein [Polyangia bacterium]
MASRALSQRLPASEGTSVSRGREIGGIVLLAFALFLGLSLVSLQFGSGRLMGPVGARAGITIYAVLGLAGYLVVWALGALAIRLFAQKPVGLVRVDNLGYFGMAGAGAVLMHILFGAYRLQGHSPGGAVGEYLGEFLAAFVGSAGAVLLALAGVALSIVLCTDISMGRAILAVRRAAAFVLRSVARAARAVGRRLWAAWPYWPHRSAANDEDAVCEAALPGASAPASAPYAAHAEEPAATSGPVIVAPVALSAEKSAALASAVSPDDDDPDHTEELALAQAALRMAELRLVPRPRPEEDSGGVVIAENDAGDTSRTDSGQVMAAVVAELQEDTEPEAEPEPDALAMPEPVIIESQFRAKSAEELEQSAPAGQLDFIKLRAGAFALPGPDLLDYEAPEGAGPDRVAMKELAVRLEKALSDYGVRGRVTEIHPGPVVTMYEFVPEAGIKLSRITNLNQDLAMALEAISVRIVAPIPGKAAVGFEVPNRTRETVYLKEIVTDEAFTKARSKLMMALGKDISGRPVSYDLAKMPHLLVAGTTGSGKSVSMHDMISSLLMSATPDEVRMIMVDPKMLEFTIYEGIPHLLLPVVTDPKKANLALKWAVDEMDRRYELLSAAGVRDIASYNKKIAKQLGEDGDGKPARPKRIQVVVAGPDGVEQTIEADAQDEPGDGAPVACVAAVEDISAPAALPPRKLPYIVIIIDEFSDLMMCASKDVETSVARIAQKARAAGIHLILATQRPSVDVITGLIKANFPSRMALRVASRIDARTILDQQGAESLLGQGDMLFSNGGAAPVRVHGAYVSDTEVKRLVDFLKQQGKPVYDLEILKPRAEEADGGAPPEEENDPLYDDAVALVARSRKASISAIQRHLRVGYNKAARFVERMERDGVVGPVNHLKEREVLVQAM